GVTRALGRQSGERCERVDDGRVGGRRAAWPAQDQRAERLLYAATPDEERASRHAFDVGRLSERLDLALAKAGRRRQLRVGSVRVGQEDRGPIGAESGDRRSEDAVERGVEV